MGEGLFYFITFHSIIKNCLSFIIKLFHQSPRLHRNPIMGKCLVKHRKLVFPVLLFPVFYRAVLQRQLLIHCPFFFYGMNPAQPFTGWAGAFPGIEGKICACYLIHTPAAFTAIHVHIKVISFFLRLLPAAGCRNQLAAVRTSPAAQLFINHTQIRVNIRHGAYRGTGIPVRIRLGNHYCRGCAPHAFHLRLMNALKGHGFQILPLAFIVENIDEKRGFTGTGKARKYHKFISGDIQRNIFQIAFGDADNTDI